MVKSPVMPKLLVNHVKQIKDMKEEFKQHVNVIALQAFCVTWQVSPANFPSSLGRPTFLSSPAKQKFSPPPPSSQNRLAPGTSGEFSGWSNVSSVSRCQRQAT